MNREKTYVCPNCKGTGQGRRIALHDRSPLLDDSTGATPCPACCGLGHILDLRDNVEYQLESRAVDEAMQEPGI